MTEPLRSVPRNAVVAGWDFSPTTVEGFCWDVTGKLIAEYHFDTGTSCDNSELSVPQVEGLARTALRGLIPRLRAQGRDHDLIAAAVTANERSSARIDPFFNSIRKIRFRDESARDAHHGAIERLGGTKTIREWIGTDWELDSALTHLLRDEHDLTPKQWQRTKAILPFGTLAVSFLLGKFASISPSSASATGLLDLRTNQWRKEMLGALLEPAHRTRAWDTLPDLIDMNSPLGRVPDSLAIDVVLPESVRPYLFPTHDHASATLLGLGIVNSSAVCIDFRRGLVISRLSSKLPTSSTLETSRTNWGTFLWRRRFENGLDSLATLVGNSIDPETTVAARSVTPGATELLPFVKPEPLLGPGASRVVWLPARPNSPGERLRAAYEALAYLAALGVRELEESVKSPPRLVVLGVQDDFFLEVLATVLQRPLEVAALAPYAARGAAIGALAGLESYLRGEQGVRERFTVNDATTHFTMPTKTILPRTEWIPVYRTGCKIFADRVRQ